MTFWEFLKAGVFNTSFVSMLLRISTPIMFGAFGAMLFDKAGIMNIGLEGVMLFSALSGVIFSSLMQSALCGVLGAILCGVLLSLFFGYCVMKLKTPGNLCALALNMLATGGTIFLLYWITGEKGSSAALQSISVPTVEIPFIKDIPVLGPILSGHNILTYLAFLCAIVVSVLIFHTPIGTRMRAVGENAEAASSVGINVHRVRYLALVLSGVMIGLGGAFMSMGYMNWFVRDMTAGRGYIAIAAEATGQGTPIGTFLSAMLFALMESLSNALQIMSVPSELLRMIPYAATLIALTAYGIATTRRIKRDTKYQQRLKKRRMTRL